MRFPSAHRKLSRERIEEIDNVLAARVNSGSNDLSDSISDEFEVLGNESIRGTPTDHENISMSDTDTENALDKSMIKNNVTLLALLRWPN